MSTWSLPGRTRSDADVFRWRRCQCCSSAPALILKGSRLPPVTSRYKKFFVFPQYPRFCAVKPLAGSLLSAACGSVAGGTMEVQPGVAVRHSTLPVLLTLIELAAHQHRLQTLGSSPPNSRSRLVNKTQTGRRHWPSCCPYLPLLVQSRRWCSSVVERIRALFSFNLIESKPRPHRLTQSNPIHSLPWTMISSAVTTSLTVIGPPLSQCSKPRCRIRFVRVGLTRFRASRRSRKNPPFSIRRARLNREAGGQLPLPAGTPG